MNFYLSVHKISSRKCQTHNVTQYQCNMNLKMFLCTIKKNSKINFYYCCIHSLVYNLINLYVSKSVFQWYTLPFTLSWVLPLTTSMCHWLGESRSTGNMCIYIYGKTMVYRNSYKDRNWKCWVVIISSFMQSTDGSSYATSEELWLIFMHRTVSDSIPLCSVIKMHVQFLSLSPWHYHYTLIF